MKVGDVICIPAHRYKVERKNPTKGIIIDILWDDKIVTGEPIKFYKVLWTSGIIGSISDYYVKSASRLEVINGTRLDSKVD